MACKNSFSDDDLRHSTEPRYEMAGWSHYKAKSCTQNSSSGVSNLHIPTFGSPAAESLVN